MLSTSDSDSDYSPHFKTIETTALVEPERSLTYQKCNATTKKINRNLNKNNIILCDLDKIEVLSDHNNESNSMIKSFSYEAFRNQLNVAQENSAQELNPLTSTRVHNETPNKQRIAPKMELPRIQYNTKKFEYEESSSEEDLYGKLLEILKQGKKPLPKKESKPVKIKPLAHPYPYIKKFNFEEDSSENNSIFEAIQKEQKTVKRGRPITTKKKIFKKSKAGENGSKTHLPRSFHKNVLPKIKPKQPLLTEKLIGVVRNYNQKDDAWSLSSLELDKIPEPKDGMPCSVPVLKDDTTIIVTKPKESTVENSKQDDYSFFHSTPNDGSKTLTSEICPPLEPLLEDDKVIVTKPKESSVGILKCVRNFKQDEFSSLSSLSNSFELNSDLEPIEGKIKIKNSKAVKVKILSDCHLKPNEEKHPPVKDLFVSNANTEVIPNQPMVLSQGNSLDRFDQFEMSECSDSGLLAKNKFKKGNMEIYEWIATGGETQEDAIFNQTEERLKEMSKIIQNSLNAIHGPITFKNCKFYDFLVELENSLNAYFSPNSDIKEKDNFDNFM